MHPRRLKAANPNRRRRGHEGLKAKKKPRLEANSCPVQFFDVVEWSSLPRVRRVHFHAWYNTKSDACCKPRLVHATLLQEPEPHNMRHLPW